MILLAICTLMVSGITAVDYVATGGVCQDLCGNTAPATFFNSVAPSLDQNSEEAASAWCSAEDDCLGYHKHYQWDRVYLRSALEHRATECIGLSNGGPEPTNTCYVKQAPADPCENANCADNLVCVAGECQRDCSAFQIDEFLDDCSVRYDDNTGAISTLKDDVIAVNARLDVGGDVDQRLDTIETDIDDTNERLDAGGDVYLSIAATNARLNAGGDVNTQLSEIETSINDVDIATNARLDPSGDVYESIVDTNDRLDDGGDIDVRLETINGRLEPGGDIDVRLVAINERLDEGGDVEGRLDSIEQDILTNREQLDRYSAQSEGSFANVINDGEGVSNPNSWFSTGNKDVLIVFLLLLNTVTMVSVCIACILCRKSEAKHGKYSVVSVDSSADDERQQLQSLN